MPPIGRRLSIVPHHRRVAQEGVFIRIFRRLTITPDTADKLQRLTAKLRNRSVDTDITTLASGRLLLTFENCDNQERAIFAAYQLPPEFVSAPIVFDPYLTGNRLLSTQAFRDLFRSEVIEGTKGIGIKDLTVMFTDLQGSTALYERIGDLNAFSLVSQHFATLNTVVKGNSGAIVKTIGDALMATFVEPGDGVKAPLDMLREIRTLNRELGRNAVILKIGIHNGPLIAVTLNDRLDFFGQTVNTASRVQGLADAEQICITNTIYEQPQVKSLLAGHDLVTSETTLRGIDRPIVMHKIVD